MKKLGMLLATLMLVTFTWSQEEGLPHEPVNELQAGSAWYNSPWVWVIGAALVLGALLVLTRGGSTSSESKG